MTTITRIGTTQRWSDVVIHNGTLYVVEVPATETADIHQQTREVLESLQRLLEANGSGVDKILMANIYLRDIEDIAAFNAVGCLDPGRHSPVAPAYRPVSPTKATGWKYS